MIAKNAQDLIDNPQATAKPADNPSLKSIELDEPIKRGKTVIDAVQIRNPTAGELRGVALMDVAQMDVLALRKVLPRITIPSLTDAEIGNLPLSDLMQCGVIVAGFLLTKQQKAESGYLDM